MMLDPFKEKNIPLGAGKSSMCSIALANVHIELFPGHPGKYSGSLISQKLN